MMTTRSESSSASSWSWVTNSVVTCNSFVQRAQPAPQILPDPRVEGAERLVEQEDLGLDRQRAGQSDALPLTA